MALSPKNAHVRDLAALQPYKRADGRIITSQVMKDTKEWFETALLLPHEPIRRDLIEVNFVLKHHIKPDEPWKLINLFSWYEMRFVIIIHGHHDAEEQVFFPAMNKRVHIPDKTSADHKTLMKGLDQISDLGKQFHDLGGGKENVEACKKILPLLQAQWNEVTELMLPHLAEEEEQMFEIKNHFTKEENEAITQTILKREGLTNARLMLPSIVESLNLWGSEDNLKEMATKAPLPIRLFLKYSWAASYQKYHRGALDSLYSGTQRKLIQEKASWLPF